MIILQSLLLSASWGDCSTIYAMPPFSLESEARFSPKGFPGCKRFLTTADAQTLIERGLSPQQIINKVNADRTSQPRKRGRPKVHDDRRRLWEDAHREQRREAEKTHRRRAQKAASAARRRRRKR